MKKYLILAFLSIILLFAANTYTYAQHGRCCHKAWKKDWKSNKKGCKIRKKMFHDHERVASRKGYKASKKDYKADKKEFKHHYGRHVDDYWY